MDGIQRSEAAGIFAAALEVADFLAPLSSADECDPATAGVAGMGVVRILRDLRNRLEQVPSFVDLPPEVLAALRSIGKTVQTAYTDCVAYGDMSWHLARSDLRAVAESGWQALKRSDPKNAEVLSWVTEGLDEAAATNGQEFTLTLLDRFPDTPAGNVGFIEWVYLEVREQAVALRENKHSHESIARQLANGVKWREARSRLERLSDLPRNVVDQVAEVLRRDLTIGTVEQIAELLQLALRVLRDSFEDTKAKRDDSVPCASQASLVDLIGRVERRLKAKPDLLRAVWENPETLNVREINAAAKALNLGPIFAIGEAPDWAHAPNLPPDHPVNQSKVECLTVFHPDGTALQIRRSGGHLDDETSLPVAETLARLAAWHDAAGQMCRVTDLEAKTVEVATAGDLWKALAEEKEPAITASAICIGPPIGPSIAHPTFPDASDQTKWNVLDKALALCDAEGGDRGEAMRKLIARAALGMEVDRRQIINMPLAEFVAAVTDSQSAKYAPLNPGKGDDGGLKQATGDGVEEPILARDSVPPTKPVECASVMSATSLEQVPDDADLQLPELHDRDRSILMAMLALKATSEAQRVTTEQIAVHVVKAKLGSQQFVARMPELRRRCFVATKRGKTGGHWLTKIGQNLAAKLNGVNPT